MADGFLIFFAPLNVIGFVWCIQAGIGLHRAEWRKIKRGYRFVK